MTGLKERKCVQQDLWFLGYIHMLYSKVDACRTSWGINPTPMLTICPRLHFGTPVSHEPLSVTLAAHRDKLLPASGIEHHCSELATSNTTRI